MDMSNAVDAGIFKSKSGKPLNVKSKLNVKHRMHITINVKLCATVDV